MPDLVVLEARLSPELELNEDVDERLELGYSLSVPVGVPGKEEGLDSLIPESLRVPESGAALGNLLLESCPEPMKVEESAVLLPEPEKALEN